ncbi:uncharacterized protein LOC141649243 [Silene latifolia]|uniref:uncharacterized protein LOC141649243 n=1 Tax=Silene latifolia TaxID=37657 RepID=UPI003D7741A3
MQNYLPPADSSWYWRKVCQVRDLLKDAYQQNECTEASTQMLNLKDWGVVEDDTCLICENAVENLDHLFLNCEYSKRVLQQIEIWLCYPLPVENLMDWRGRLPGSRLKKGVMNAILNAAIYHIWRQRNLSKFESKLLRPEKLAHSILTELRLRVKGVARNAIDDCDRRWLSGIQIAI